MTRLVGELADTLYFAFYSCNSSQFATIFKIYVTITIYYSLWESFSIRIYLILQKACFVSYLARFTQIERCHKCARDLAGYGCLLP